MRWSTGVLALLTGLVIAAGVGATATPSVPRVPRFGVFQQPLVVSSSAAAPWDAVTVSVQLVSPSGKKFDVGGFYVSRNRWMFRFAPSELGVWHWNAAATGAAPPSRRTGRFDVVKSSSPGFVRPNRGNLGRWIFTNGSPYYAIGLNDCTGAEGKRAALWGLDGGFRQGPGHSPGRLVGSSSYMKAYSSAGFNLFRWGPDNCSFALYDKIDPAGNVYSQAGMAATDVLFQTLRRYGFRIEMVLFGSSPPFAASGDPSQLAAVDRYVRYVVDRYGAYVDFWQLDNEAKTSDAWITQVGSYLERIDPYHHLLGTSWERPQLPVVQFGSDHWYQTESPQESDTITWSHLRGESSLPFGKPTLVDEQGNTGINWDATSALRLRLRSWTAFFAEGTLVFWNTSFIKNCCPNGTSSVYIGPEERGFVRVLQTYTRGFDPQAKIEAAQTAPAGAVRAYALRGPRSYGLYLVSAGPRTQPTSGVTATVNPAQAGTATWVDPSTGRILGRAKVRGGQQTLQVPAFTTDIALKIAPA
jgi:Domain of unknown function (DUF5060)